KHCTKPYLLNREYVFLIFFNRKKIQDKICGINKPLSKQFDPIYPGERLIIHSLLRDVLSRLRSFRGILLFRCRFLLQVSHDPKEIATNTKNRKNKVGNSACV